MHGLWLRKNNFWSQITSHWDNFTCIGCVRSSRHLQGWQANFRIWNKVRLSIRTSQNASYGDCKAWSLSCHLNVFHAKLASEDYLLLQRRLIQRNYPSDAVGIEYSLRWEAQARLILLRWTKSETIVSCACVKDIAIGPYSSILQETNDTLPIDLFIRMHVSGDAHEDPHDHAYLEFPLTSLMVFTIEQSQKTTHVLESKADPCCSCSQPSAFSIAHRKNMLLRQIICPFAIWSVLSTAALARRPI